MSILQDVASTALYCYNTADPYLRPVRSFLYDAQARTLPLLTPLLNRTLVAAQDSPSVVVVGIFLLLFVILLQVLAVLRRLLVFGLRVLWWTGLAAVLAVVGSVVWERGPERSMHDVVSWAGHLSEFWWGEYEKHKQAQARGQGGF